VKAVPRLLSAATLVLAGCSEGFTCKQSEDVRVESSTKGGSATLSLSGESVEQRLRVTFRGLPEIWSDESPIHEPSLETTLEERFAQGDPGGDGRTPMPHIALSFGSRPPPGFSATPYVPVTLGVKHRTFPLFDCLAEPGGACCRYGTTECSFVSTLFVTRAEGAELAPVTVTFGARASAVIDQCPPSSPEVELVPEESQ
jgi:hypothetical protein